MNNQFQPLSGDEVLYVTVGRVLMSNPTFKVAEFIDALAQAVSDREGDWSDDNEGWFGEEGLECEVLRFTSHGWQRGRVRLRLEFRPDEPTSKLLEMPREQREPRRTELPDAKVEDVYRATRPDPRFDDIYSEPDANDDY